MPSDIGEPDRIVSMVSGLPSKAHSFGARPKLDSGGHYLRMQFVTVFVTNQDRSLHFFVDQLGFSLVADLRFASGLRWVEVAPPDGTGSLALLRPAEESSEAQRIGSSAPIGFLTEDVLHTYEKWVSKGVCFKTAPEQTPGSSGLLCRFFDPDGNEFRLAGFDDITRQIEQERKAAAEMLELERRIAHELEIAREVQLNLLPQTMPSSDLFACAGVCIQARAVGGDFFDVFERSPQHVSIVIGDIAGTGLPAALLMVSLQCHLRAQAGNATAQLPELLRSANSLMVRNSAPNVYTTMIFIEFEPHTGALRYANCGHLPGLIFRKNGQVETLDSSATLLGLFPAWQANVSETSLSSGDLLVLYTDGITEAQNQHEEEFGEARLIGEVGKRRPLPATALVDQISRQVLSFSAGAPSDDVTVFALRVN